MTRPSVEVTVSLSPIYKSHDHLLDCIRNTAPANRNMYQWSRARGAACLGGPLGLSAEFECSGSFTAPGVVFRVSWGVWGTHCVPVFTSVYCFFS